jgi:hypothetical protein
MQDTIERNRASFIQAQDGLAHALNTTPDDRLKWSPSPTARTPLQAAGHAAAAIAYMLGNMTGETFAVATPEEAERLFRELDKEFTSKEQVMELLEKNSSAYLNWLDAATPQVLNSTMILPFGMGAIPVHAGMEFMPLHVKWHTAQINYIQTIYGDLDWHLG